MLKRDGQPVLLTIAEARAELESILASITVETFQEAARARSDCISNTSGGDLGRFGPAKVTIGVDTRGKDSNF